MLLRAITVGVGIAACAAVAAVPAAAAGPPIMPLGDVQPGMRCTAASVVHGTDVVTFDARIDDVLRGRQADASRLLFTVSGPAIDATGIGPGFSGSPITCTGADGVPRIAGAISEGIGEYGGHRGLATPIESILGEPADPPAGARVATALLRRARPLAEPRAISGLSPAVGRVYAAAAARAHRPLLAAPSATALAAQAPLVPPLVPGSAVAVSSATGDLSTGAIGTVAYVDGDAVWAFGHELDGSGRRSLTLSSAYVFTVVDNPVASADTETYKLAAPLTDLGTLVQDGGNAVVGRIGALPRRFPLRIVTTDLDRSRRRELDVQVADERPVALPEGGTDLPLLLSGGITQAAYATLQGLPAQLSARLCLRVTVAGRPAPMAFCNTYVGIGGGAEAFAGSPLTADAASAAKLLDAFEAAPLAITGVTAAVRLTRAPRLGTMTAGRVAGPVRRGTVIPVRLDLRRRDGSSFTRTVSVAVPKLMHAGTWDILLRGTDADGPGDGGASLSDLFAEDDPPAAPRTVRGLAAAIADLHHDDGLAARFVHPGTRPASRNPGGAEGAAQRRRVVFRSDELRIAGQLRVRVRVR